MYIYVHTFMQYGKVPSTLIGCGAVEIHIDLYLRIVLKVGTEYILPSVGR